MKLREVAHRDVGMLEVRSRSRAARSFRCARREAPDPLITKRRGDTTQHSDNWRTGNEPLGRVHLRAIMRA